MRTAAAALLIAIIFLLNISPTWAGTPVVDSLAARGKVRIPIERARLLESELGQLLVVNVDGFGYSGPLALEPGFVPLVNDLQIGGVIPHYGSSDYEKIRRTNRALAGMTGLPLLLCSDIVRLRGSGASAPAGKAPSASPGRSLSASFGDGYVGGFIGKYKALPDDQFAVLARLNAFVLAALGVNVSLGPTVDDSTRDARTEDRARVMVGELRRFGLEPVMKHFPFLPSGANLHRSSPDTRVPLAAAEKRVAVFRDLGDIFPIMMTTHLNDSLIDGRIVTFSPAWIGLLHRETGFNGLVMSDGLLMLKAYQDRSALGGKASAEEAGLDPTAVWALRAIMAGHDLLIVEGSAWQTRRVFDGLLAAACSGTPLGNSLADRIEQSYASIRAFKLGSAASLKRDLDVPRSTINAIIAMSPRDGADLKGFRFDAAALDSLQPALRAAEARNVEARGAEARGAQEPLP